MSFSPASPPSSCSSVRPATPGTRAFPRLPGPLTHRPPPAMYRVFAGPRMGSSVRHASHHPPLLLSPSPGAPITAYVNDDSEDLYEAF